MATKKSAKKGTSKAAAAPKVTKVTSVSSAYTKSELLNALATNTGLGKKQVVSVLDELGLVIERHLKKKEVGQFVMPGLFKVKTIRKKASKARKGTNPFTGEEMMFKAKPARTVVKILPLKKMKAMV